MTKKEAIIQYFSSMDSGMLELLLDDDRTYQDATKETFLQKLNGSFEEFNSNGDTYLAPVKGQCDSTSCNYGCSGYAFLGNNSNKRLPLVFEENESDYTDIYFCSLFKTGEDSDVNEDIWLHISKDEKATFKPSVNYLLRASECKNALLDMEKYKGKLICKEVYTEWFNKYKNLYKSIPGIFSDFNAFSKFSLLYTDIEEIIGTVLFDSKARKALRDYDKIPDYNEKLLLDWLLKYEDIGKHIAFFLLDYNGSPYLDEPIALPRVKDVFIDKIDFINYINFSEEYDKQYKFMWTKHNTFEDGKCPPEIPHEDFYSLRYHLKKKALIK